MSASKAKGAGYEYPGKDTLTFAVLPGYRNLIVWQKASELANLTHDATRGLGSAYFKLRGQTLDAAESVPANIAEGYCSGSINNYVRYCEIARGSLGELGTHLHTCERWKVIDPALLPPAIQLYGDVRYLLDRMLSALRQKQTDKSWDSSYAVRESAPVYEVPKIADEIETFHASYQEATAP
ncbi:MAG: four helix bundle protein [Anaerolineae bacterium]|nr:four helix bundle protein [Anaerolineae bacterium]